MSQVMQLSAQSQYDQDGCLIASLQQKDAVELHNNPKVPQLEEQDGTKEVTL